MTKIETLIQQAKTHIQEITIHQLITQLDANEQLTLIDVRERYEWEKGHAQQAIHIGRGILEFQIEKIVPDPQTVIILYCAGGFRSALAAESLQRMGYQQVNSLIGGFKAWLTAGLPVAV